MWLNKFHYQQEHFRGENQRHPDKPAMLVNELESDRDSLDVLRSRGFQETVNQAIHGRTNSCPSPNRCQVSAIRSISYIL